MEVLLLALGICLIGPLALIVLCTKIIALDMVFALIRRLIFGDPEEHLVRIYDPKNPDRLSKKVDKKDLQDWLDYGYKVKD